MDSSASLASTDLGAIRAALLRVAGHQQSGAQLRALIDYTCPGLDLRAAAGVPTGPGALTAFLRTHFSDIVHPIGKRGGDNLFLIGPPTGSPIVPTVAGNFPAAVTFRPVSLWTAFASPALGYEVVFDRVDGSLSVQAKGGMLSSQQVRLAPISAQEFRTIATQFVGSAPSVIQDELRKILEEGDRFYQIWISALKTKDPATYHRWGLFRVQEIVALFRARLANAAVPPEDLEKAVQALVADQAAAYSARARAVRGAIEPLEQSGTQRTLTPVALEPQAADIKDVRAFAALAINSMSLTEIRQLSVPLGAIIDAVSLSKR